MGELKDLLGNNKGAGDCPGRAFLVHWVKQMGHKGGLGKFDLLMCRNDLGTTHVTPVLIFIFPGEVNHIRRIVLACERDPWCNSAPSKSQVCWCVGD